MAVITAYFDASGSPTTDVIAACGVLSTPEKWANLNRRWNECLDGYGVSALHMKDFAHSNGDFAFWRNDQPKRKRFLNNLLWIIEEEIEFTSAAAVPMLNYRQCDGKYKLSEFMRPYTLASMMCAAQIVPWAEKSGYRREEIVYVFEKDDEDQKDLRRYWGRAYPELLVEPIFKKKVDCYPHPDVKARIRPFEVADFIAYENLKANIALNERGGWMEFDDLRKPIQRMRKLPGAEDWCFAEANGLEVFCHHSLVELRS
jgi:hypothetical protein